MTGGPDIPGAKFGSLPGLPVGTRWADRKSMSEDHMHPPLIAGIYGRKADGARSVVLAGEYDDEDHGDTFTYIGSGGREPGIRLGPQTMDQNFENNLNQALLMSAKLREPVRVIRGPNLRSKYTPYASFRYDGLYTVHNPRIEEAPNGFKVCKFDFRRCPGQPPLQEFEGPPMGNDDIVIRRSQHRQARKKRDGSAPPVSAAATGPVPAKWEGVGEGPSSKRPILNADTSSRRMIEPDEGSLSDGLSSDGRFTSSHTVSSNSVQDNITFEDLGLESEEEDQEQLFATIDRVEREFNDVNSKLQELNRPGDTPQIHKRRKELIVELGDYIWSILRRKRSLEREKFDQALWERLLWDHVSTFVPTRRGEETFKSKNLIRIYEKHKRRQVVRRRKESKQEQRSANESGG